MNSLDTEKILAQQPSPHFLILYLLFSRAVLHSRGAPLPLKASFAFLDLVFSRTSSSILPGKFFQHRSHFALAKTSPFPHFFSVFHHSNIWFFLHLLTRPSKLGHTKCFVPLGRSTDTQIVTESVQPREGHFCGKEVYSVHLGRPEGTLIVTARQDQRGLFCTFGKVNRKPKLLLGGGIVTLKGRGSGKGGRGERSVLGWMGVRTGA